ncbi:hypothetical protein [Streptomyces chryseus]|uniref:hypothetical protein n=1 Tax=Streptomyces chryseus TaxID=68186 RepID=UPI001ABFBA37|nr:hypothetical protein [Streptomyces chryseus]
MGFAKIHPDELKSVMSGLGVWPDIGEPADPVLFGGLVGGIEVPYLVPPAIMVIALAVVELVGRTA